MLNAANNAENDGVKLFIVDAALLFEAGFTEFFNSVLLITAEKSIRYKRILLRKNIPENQIEKSNVPIRIEHKETDPLRQHNLRPHIFTHFTENYARNICELNHTSRSPTIAAWGGSLRSQPPSLCRRLAPASQRSLRSLGGDSMTWAH